MSQKIAKKLRREVNGLKFKLASELKGIINSLPLMSRIYLAVKIILKKEW